LGAGRDRGMDVQIVAVSHSFSARKRLLTLVFCGSYLRLCRSAAQFRLAANVTAGSYTGSPVMRRFTSFCAARSVSAASGSVPSHSTTAAQSVRVATAQTLTLLITVNQAQSAGAFPITLLRKSPQ